MMFPKKTKFNGKFSNKNKYNEVKAEREGGLSFASKLEASLYDYLKLCENNGEIKIEEIQSSVKLTRAQIRCIPDFRIYDNELKCQVWCEAKGLEMERWKLIKKLWCWYGPGPLRIYKGTYKSLYLDEVIIPNTGES